MKALLALMIAAIAIAAQPQDIPPRFTRGFHQRGHAVVTADFYGAEWKCGGETCWAGISDGWLSTGP